MFRGASLDLLFLGCLLESGVGDREHPALPESFGLAPGEQGVSPAYG